MSVADLPETVELQTGDGSSGSVIWLHGLGADGHDFEPVIPELALPDSLQLRFIFPHASIRPVTINGGMPMRAWFDVLGLDRAAGQDDAGIRASAAQLSALISREHERGIPFNRIVLAGFSQGGCIALHTGLRYPQRLAGVMGLSTYLVLEHTLPEEVEHNPQAQTRQLPIFMAHGTADPVLPFSMGQQSAQRVREAGYSIEWHEYPMAHSLCIEEIRAIRAWLLKVYSVAG